MMELMTSSPSSKLTTIALLAVLVCAAVAPAAAVSVAEPDVPDEGEVGTQVSASVKLTDLYREPQWDTWTLKAQTHLRNVTWTVRYIDQTGTEYDTETYDGQRLSGGNGVELSTETDTTEVSVEVVGEVPEPSAYTYPQEERFTIMDLTQTRGEEGSRNDIDSWETHHYTTGTADEPGSQEAREAISQAEAAIADAEDAGADTSQAEASLGNAIEFYESGQFTNAVENAETAEEEATTAKEDYESSQQTQQYLLYAVVAIVLLALVGGGFWYYQQQQDDYDKLG